MDVSKQFGAYIKTDDEGTTHVVLDTNESGGRGGVYASIESGRKHLAWSNDHIRTISDGSRQLSWDFSQPHKVSGLYATKESKYLLPTALGMAINQHKNVHGITDPDWIPSNDEHLSTSSTHLVQGLVNRGVPGLFFSDEHKELASKRNLPIVKKVRQGEDQRARKRIEVEQDEIDGIADGTPYCHECQSYHDESTADKNLEHEYEYSDGSWDSEYEKVDNSTIQEGTETGKRLLKKYTRKPAKQPHVPHMGHDLFGEYRDLNEDLK